MNDLIAHLTSSSYAHVGLVISVLVLIGFLVRHCSLNALGAEISNFVAFELN
jgi:hypothetical protein